MSAPDATAGDGLREAIDRALFRSGADNYDLAPDLILAALRDVLAAAARDAEKVRRVRELHAPVMNWTEPECEACSTYDDDGCSYIAPWPCPTIQALDGAR